MGVWGKWMAFVVDQAKMGRMHYVSRCRVWENDKSVDLTPLSIFPCIFVGRRDWKRNFVTDFSSIFHISHEL